MPVPRLRAFLLVAAAFVCVGAVTAGAHLYKRSQLAGVRPIPGLLNELPSDAPALVYIDVAALRALDPQDLSTFSHPNPAKTGDRDYQQFVEETGFDFARDLDRVAIAIWPAPPGAPNTPATHDATPGVKSPPSPTITLAVADGRFDQSKIEAYAMRSGKVVDRGKLHLYEVPGNPPIALRFLSSSRIEMASGEEAITRFADPGAEGLSDSMRALIDRVSDAPIFLVGEAAPFSGNVASSSNSALPGAAGFARSVKAMALAGLPAGGGFDIKFEAQCDTPANAAGMLAMLNGIRTFGAMALADPKSQGKMTKEQTDAVAGLLSQIKIEQQEVWVRVTVHLTPEMLAAAKQQAIANQQAATERH